MKQQFSANKGILAAIVIFIILMVIYKIFFRHDVEFIPDETVASTIGDDILNLKTELEKVNFDQSLFSLPDYLGLVDLTVPVPQFPVGRSNPFDIIGRD